MSKIVYEYYISNLDARNDINERELDVISITRDPGNGQLTVWHRIKETANDR